jgi:hypothetical protein
MDNRGKMVDSMIGMDPIVRVVSTRHWKLEWKH